MTQPQQLPQVVVQPPSEECGATTGTSSSIPSNVSLANGSRSLNGHASGAPTDTAVQQHQGPPSSATETTRLAAGLLSHPAPAPAPAAASTTATDLSLSARPVGLPAIPTSVRLVRAASLPAPSHGTINHATSTAAAYPGAGLAAAEAAAVRPLRNGPSEVSFHNIDGTSAAAAASAMALACTGEASPMSSSESSMEATAAAGAPAAHAGQPNGVATGAGGGFTGCDPSVAEAEEGRGVTVGFAPTGTEELDGGGVHVVQRKGRFTLLKPAAQADSDHSVTAQSTTPSATPAAVPAAAPGPFQAADPAPVTVVATAPVTSSDTGQAVVQQIPTEPANVTKRKGRFTLTQESNAPLTIVVDRAPGPPPHSVQQPHQPPSNPLRERGSSAASTAMSSISASIAAGAEQGSIAPPAPAAVPAPATATAATQAVTTAASPSLASNSSVRTIKKMGRFVVSSVSGSDPQTTVASAAATVVPPTAPQQEAVAPGPPPSAAQDPGHYPPSVLSDSGGPAYAASSAVPQPRSGEHGIPREVVTVVDPGLAVPSEASFAQRAAQTVHQPLIPPSLPPPSQPVMYALVPANVHLPSQPSIASGSAHSAGPTHSYAQTGQADNVGSASIRPVLSSGNLAAVDVAAARQDAYVQASPAMSARLPARESESVPIPPAVNDTPRPMEVPPTTTAQPPPPASGATARNGGYTGRQGVGKMFHYLDQLRLEATDAERTIKNLQTDVRLLKEKNKELEATARDTERKLIEERKLREVAEYKLKQAKKKLRDLTHAASHSVEDHAKSSATSYDSIGIAASLSGEYRDERMTIDPPNEAIGASVPPVSPPFCRRPEQAYTPTRDFGTTMMGDGSCPVHSSPTAAAAFVANGNLSAQHSVDQGRQSASNSPRPSQQGRVVSSTSKLPPLPSSGAAPAGIGNGGSARTPNDRPPLGSSTNARENPYPSQNGSLPPNRSLAMEFDPMRTGNRERLPSGDSMSDLPEMTSVPVAHAAFPSAVHPVSPTQRQASKTYHGVRDLHQQFHLQQPALEPTAPILTASSSFSDFKHMVLVPQQLETLHGGSPIVFAFPSSYSQNGNQQWIPVAVHDPSMIVGRVDPTYQGSTSFQAPSPDPFDEIVRRSSNAG